MPRPRRQRDHAHAVHSHVTCLQLLRSPPSNKRLASRCSRTRVHPPTSLPPTSRCLPQALITVAFAAALPWLLRTAPGLLLAFPVTGGIPFLMHGLLMRVNDGWIVSEERRRKANSRFSHNVPLLSLYNIFEVGGARVPSWAKIICMPCSRRLVLQRLCMAMSMPAWLHLAACCTAQKAVRTTTLVAPSGIGAPMPLALMPRYIVVAGMASVACSMHLPPAACAQHVAVHVPTHLSHFVAISLGGSPCCAPDRTCCTLLLAYAHVHAPSDPAHSTSFHKGLHCKP